MSGRSVVTLHSTPQCTGTVGEYILLATMWTCVTEVPGLIQPPLVGRQGRACIDKLLPLEAWCAQPLRWPVPVNTHPAAGSEGVCFVHAYTHARHSPLITTSCMDSSARMYTLRDVHSEQEQQASSSPIAQALGLMRIASVRSRPARQHRCWQPQHLRAQHQHAQQREKEGGAASKQVAGAKAARHGTV